MHKVLVVLAVLLALPFSLKVKADDLTAEDIIEINRRLDSFMYEQTISTDSDWGNEDIYTDEIAIFTPTFVVCYFDTVGFKKHTKTVQVPCPGYPYPGAETGIDNFTIGCLVIHYGDIEWWAPVLDTIIIGHFWTDSTKRIKDWRVMEAK